MKKLFTLSAMIFAMCVCVNAQNVVFSDDCEDATIRAAYTIIDADGDGFNWEIGEAPSKHTYSGNYCWFSSSYDNGSVSALLPDNYLITPQINIPANSTLSWWVTPQDKNYYAEHYGVYISTTLDINNFTLLFEETINFIDYTSRTVDLSAHVGSFYIAFRHFNSSDEFQMNIDDILITTTSPIDPGTDPVDPGTDPVDPGTDPVDPGTDPVDPGTDPGTGINDATTYSVSLYPSPVTDVLNVHAEGYKTIEIVNFLGQIVYSSNITNNTMQINTTDLTAGVYFVKLSGNNTVTKKFVKK